MEAELERVVRHLAQVKWPFRLHATYDQTIGRALDVFEKVNREVPFGGTHWFFDHAETISPANIDRVKALGGGIAVQHRMAYQGEDFAARYGKDVAADAPPLTRILAAGVPLGAGTDATRVASYNPWVSLYWLVTGRTIGGLALYPLQIGSTARKRCAPGRKRTPGSPTRKGRKARSRSGQLADLAVLSADYMNIPEDEIKDLTSVLTVLGGQVVHGEGPFRTHSPPLPPASPDWSPVNQFGGYYDRNRPTAGKAAPGNRLEAAVAGRVVRAHEARVGLACDCWIG